MVRIVLALLFILSTSVRAQPANLPMTPEQQDVINMLLRESSGERERARVAELAAAKAQRELADALKRVTACKTDETPAAKSPIGIPNKQ